MLLEKLFPAREWLEGTILLVFVYLVLSNAKGFAQIIGASSSGYAASVKALQGR